MSVGACLAADLAATNIQQRGTGSYRASVLFLIFNNLRSWLTKYVYFHKHSIVCIMYLIHYNDVIMTTMASQITSLTIVYSIVYSGPDQRKYQSSASLAFVWGIHRGSVNSPHKWPVTRKMFPFDDVIMFIIQTLPGVHHSQLYQNIRNWHKPWCLVQLAVR